MHLANGHIIIPQQIAALLFEAASQVCWVYYPKQGNMMIASQDDDLFKSLHKTNMSMLKYKNAVGDRSISAQELLLDHNDILTHDRSLEYKVDEVMKILNVKLK